MSTQDWQKAIQSGARVFTDSADQQTARSTAAQLEELRALRSEQAAETTRAIEAEAQRRVRELEAERIVARRHRGMFWLTVVSALGAVVAAGTGVWLIAVAP